MEVETVSVLAGIVNRLLVVEVVVTVLDGLPRVKDDVGTIVFCAVFSGAPKVKVLFVCLSSVGGGLVEVGSKSLLLVSTTLVVAASTGSVNSLAILDVGGGVAFSTAELIGGNGLLTGDSVGSSVAKNFETADFIKAFAILSVTCLSSTTATNKKKKKIQT